MDQSVPASLQGLPGSSSTQDQVEGEDDSDMLELWDKEEAQEFTNFDPTMNNDNVRDVREIINAFLNKHFRNVDHYEGLSQTILLGLQTPKLDEDMKQVNILIPKNLALQIL